MPDRVGDIEPGHQEAAARGSARRKPVGIDQLQPWAGVSEDDSQPFPIYGWLNVWWQAEQVVVKGPKP